LLVLLVIVGVVIGVVVVRGGLVEEQWVAFSPPGGDCSVLMPGTPTLNNAGIPNMPGIQASKFMLQRPRQKDIYILAVLDFPANLPVNQGTLKLMSDAERDNARTSSRGRVVYDKDIAGLGGYLGHEFQVDAPDGSGLIERVYLGPHGAGTRCYLL